MKRKTGWVVDTLESLYAGPGAPNLDFGARTLRAMAPGLDLGAGAGFSLVDFNDMKWRFFGMVLPDGALLDLSQHPPGLGFSQDQVSGLFKRLYDSPAPVSLLTELLGVRDVRDEPGCATCWNHFRASSTRWGCRRFPGPGWACARTPRCPSA